MKDFFFLVLIRFGKICYEDENFNWINGKIGGQKKTKALWTRPSTLTAECNVIMFVPHWKWVTRNIFRSLFFFFIGIVSFPIVRKKQIRKTLGKLRKQQVKITNNHQSSSKQLISPFFNLVHQWILMMQQLARKNVLKISFFLLLGFIIAFDVISLHNLCCNTTNK